MKFNLISEKFCKGDEEGDCFECEHEDECVDVLERCRNCPNTDHHVCNHICKKV